MVLSQFSSTDGKLCLKDFFKVDKDVYPVGRLDYDSEGLLILTNDAALNNRLLLPEFLHEREYMVQVDGAATQDAVKRLEEGVTIKVNEAVYHTKRCKAFLFQQPPVVPDRNPPVRFRKSIPTSWVRIILTEGKNRQVRKMMAYVGFPVLRLIRCRIESIEIQNMQPGDMISVSGNTMYKQLFRK